MKAILIDVVKREVREVELERGSLASIYQALGVEMIELATYLENGDAVFVDEEGLLNGRAAFGWFDIGAHQPFAWNGLVLGQADFDGNTTDCKSTVEEVRASVTFLRFAQVYE